MSHKILLTIIVVSALIGTGLIVANYLEKYKEPSLADLSAMNPVAESEIVNSEEGYKKDGPAGLHGNGSANTAPVNSTRPVKEQSTKTMNKEHLVTIETDLGNIQFVTYDADAPNTVKNFIALAEKGFYNGIIFHRAIDGFMIQGGDPTGTGTGGPGYIFDDELNPATDSYKEGYKKGVVAMANAGPNTNGSQFFIMVADAPLPKSYTIFGKVVSGEDIAVKISEAPRDRRNNDRPLTPVKMNKVTVEKSTSY